VKITGQLKGTKVSGTIDTRRSNAARTITRGTGKLLWKARKR
jgi:hypothetical protein